jgi:oxygen-dependent protoporphyrinogen oxidase
VTRIVVAGGGIAGLSIAHAIRRRDPTVDVIVLEGAARTGGNIQTETVDGYTCESGPDGFLDNAPDTLELVRHIGLEPRLQPSLDAARRRFIFADGRLHEVPLSPGAFLRSRLISARAKLRIAWEPFAGPRVESDESIHDFASRRIGHEAASTLVDPMVSGIFAGDPHALSLRACFPKMATLEDDHGGLFRALLATRRRRARSAGIGTPAGRLTSFRNGLSELPDALTRALGTAVRTSTPVLSLSAPPDTRAQEAAGLYTVSTTAGPIRADAVVLSGPAAESARMIRPFDATLASLLEGIPTAPLAVVCLGYDARALAARCPLDGFGFLVRRHPATRILGALWESSIYPNRAPAGKALLRVMLGGARDTDAVAMTDSELLATARRDLAHTMAVDAPPEFIRTVRHFRGIPQYVKGHLARLHRIETLMQIHPGLHLAGNSYRGVSINSCVAESGRIAGQVLTEIRRRPTASRNSGAFTLA